MNYSAFLFLCFLLIGCRPIPPYQPPVFNTPDHWKEKKDEESASTPAAYEGLENWWDIFNDSSLDELEEQGLKNNPTLEIATWRIIEAKAEIIRAQSFLYPNILFNPNTFNQLQLTRFPEITADTTNTTNPFIIDPVLQRFKTTQYNIPFLFSYEFDLWNRLGYGVESTRATAQAQEEAWRTTQLSLTAAIATAYFSIRIHDAEEKILRDTIRSRTEAFEINSIRYKAGLINYSDVSRAETELWLAKVDLSQVLLVREQQEHLLATLIGESPAFFNQSFHPLSGDPPNIIPILPSEVLLRRPDLTQAERELASFYAQEGVAVATLFPSLSIDTQIGFSAPVVGELLSWKARFFSLAWTSFQTIFDAGRRQADIIAAKARVNQALNHYSERVLNAFKEVEDTISIFNWKKIATDQLNHAVESSKTTTDLATERYNKGLVTYLEVVDSERTFLNTQLSAVRSRGDLFLSTIDMIKAIGGSWNTPSDKSTDFKSHELCSK